MPIEITMPQQSDTMTEGTVVKWLKKEGDRIKAGEIIAEIETDKATMEMEAFDSGTLAVILVSAGGKAAVGAVRPGHRRSRKRRQPHRYRRRRRTSRKVRPRPRRRQPRDPRPPRLLRRRRSGPGIITTT